MRITVEKKSFYKQINLNQQHCVSGSLFILNLTKVSSCDGDRAGASLIMRYFYDFRYLFTFCLLLFSQFKNTLTRILFLALFSVFGNVMKYFFSFSSYYIAKKVLLRTETKQA